VERELDLEPVEVIREHRFEDRSRLRVHGGSRGAQLAAFEELGTGLGQQWVDFVASYGEVWELLRQHYFEVATSPRPAEVSAVLEAREMLAKRIRRTFKDRRLRLVAGFPAEAEGHNPRDVPAWAGLVHYLEQRFGAWTVPGGMHQLAAALTARLATRGVTVRTGLAAADLVVRSGRVVAVATAAGEIEADHVVCAIDPRRLPALERFSDRTLPAMPPQVFHLGLGDAPQLPAGEVVLHGDPLLVVRGRGNAWTVHARGKLLEDVTVALARHRLDVRDQVVTRVDLGVRELVGRWGGSPYGLLWQGRSTLALRHGPTTPIRGLYAAGAHANPGAGLPYVGLSAALVAQAIGPA
jgi:UDP-galactopyranose mutase